MSEKISPALTAEEWKDARMSSNYFAVRVGKGIVTRLTSRMEIEVEWHDGPVYAGVDRPAVLAALALYSQPFGFTFKDVMDVRAAARMLAYRLPEIDVGPSETRTAVGRLNSLADRLEALLPPNALDTTAFTP